MEKLRYTFSRKGDKTLVLTIAGWLNASNADELAVAQAKETEDETITNIVWDASGLTLIASAGLRVLMSAYKLTNARKGKTFLVGANDNVLKVVKSIKLDMFVMLASSLDTLEDSDLQ